MSPAAPDDTALVVATEWRRRTQAEYTSAAIAHHVTLWLLQLGAPPDLIRDGLRVVEDELTHSELSAAVASAAAVDMGPVVIDAAFLTTLGPDGSTIALANSILRFFCIGETVAVPLFRMLRANCSVPIARRALDRILRDEAGHRQFGWDVIDWLILSGGEPMQRYLEGELPGALEEVSRAYGVDSQPREGFLSSDVTAWGLAQASAYAHTLVTALARDVLPRLAERGLTPPDGGSPKRTP